MSKAQDTYRAMLEALGWCAGALAVGFGEYDQDDREADRIWDEIDDHMDQRRRAQREKLLKAQLEEMRKKNPKITETFADLKRDLRESMTQADWEVCAEAECACPMSLLARLRMSCGCRPFQRSATTRSRSRSGRSTPRCRTRSSRERLQLG